MAEPLCLFCLEEIKENQRCPNLVGCGCEVKCHISCLQAWFQQKEQMECPICHHISVMNPIQPPREYVIVHVQALPNHDQIRRTEAREKICVCCCFTMLIWWIFALIFEYAF